MAMSKSIGKFACRAFFVVLGPALLTVWGRRLDRSHIVWPLAPGAPITASLVALGMILLAAATRALWSYRRVDDGSSPMC
jgi:hypothetical protein